MARTTKLWASTSVAVLLLLAVQDVFTARLQPLLHDRSLQALTTNGISLNGISFNGVSLNGFNINGVRLNGLTINGISMNSLTYNSLSSSSLEELPELLEDNESGEAARALIKYLAQCALSPSQSVSVTYEETYTDPNGSPITETYEGVFGLAESWATGQLTNVLGQKWVTACLLAHVNYYGKAVQISVRGAPDSLKKATVGAELANYKKEEGAFWGNIFSTAPYLYTCYNENNIEYSRSLYRDCAAGHVMPDGSLDSCGPVQRMGSCQKTCSGNTGKGQYRNECKVDADGSATDAVITVYLP